MEDFSIRFCESSNPNGFIENWPNYARDVKKIMTKYYKARFHTMWPQAVEEVISFLKIMPAKAGPKTPPGTVLPFNKAVEKFIVFSEVLFMIFYNRNSI